LIPLEKIQGARETIAGAAIRTPLVRLHAPEAAAEIYLKLENLQPIGSFKIRGATNAIRCADAEAVANGVVTASAGNMAQGVAWAARERGVPATIVVPEHAPETKLAAIERLGGKVVKVSFGRWWQAIVEARFDEAEGLFVHPVQDELEMAGNGTIGLEILEDLPEPDVVLIPYGGGGLTVGIASAIKALSPQTRIYPVEPVTGAPLAVSLAAGEPREADFAPSFVDGSGSPRVLPAMFELVRPLVDGSFTASLDDVAASIRLLVERVRVIAEGAGALAPAVALSGRAGSGKIVAVVSGGNIDVARLTAILAGGTPA
jgi:threonine dehydratase